MESKLIIDTDILIDFFRGKSYAKEAIKDVTENGVEIVTTDINAFELYFGAYKSNSERNLAAVKGFLNSITLLSTSGDSSEIAGKIAYNLEKRGKSIEVRDLIIASIALVNNCGVMTNNKEHFSRIKELKIVTPRR